SLEEEIIREAAARKLPVIGDIELFAWHVRAKTASKVLAVTGTNGKSTVTALTGHLLRHSGIDCEVAGNIGPPAGSLGARAFQLPARDHLVAQAERRRDAQPERRSPGALRRPRRIRRRQ